MRFKETGCVVTLTLPVAAEAYVPMVLGDTVIIPETDVEANKPGAYIVPGCAGRVVDAPKHQPGRAWSQGQTLLWDPVNKRWTDNKNQAQAKISGVAAKAAAANDATGEVLVVAAAL